MYIPHISKCPICGEELVGSLQGSCQAFSCYTPLADQPLHYYSHTVAPYAANRIDSQEFSVKLKNKWIIFSNNYLTELSTIKFSTYTHQDMATSFLLVPDFPNLENLKNKIRMTLTFG